MVQLLQLLQRKEVLQYSALYCLIVLGLGLLFPILL